MKAFFVSDVHIGKGKIDRYLLFLDFLNFVEKEKVDCLFIVGDLFEFLYKDTKYLEKNFKDLFDKIKILENKGVFVYYIYGNHDFNFIIKNSRVICTQSVDDIKIGKFSLSVMHGDGLDPQDVKYRLLKSIVRSRFFSMFVSLIPQGLIYLLGDYFSSLSRNLNKKHQIKKRSHLHYRRYAVSKLQASNVDIVVLAHTHVAELYSFINKKGEVKYYINTGFFGCLNTYGVLDDTGISLRVFDKKC